MNPRNIECLWQKVYSKWASLIAQSVKNLPAMQKTRVQFLGREDLLEKERETYSSILAGKSHGQRGLMGYTVRGVAKSRTRLSN